MDYDKSIAGLKAERQQVINQLVDEYHRQVQEIESLRHNMSVVAKEKAMTVMRLRSLMGAQEVADVLGTHRSAVYAALSEARGELARIPLECGHSVQPDQTEPGNVIRCPVCKKTVIAGMPETI